MNYKKIYDLFLENKVDKKVLKEDPQLLFKNRKDCKVVGENDKFIFVLPLSYNACVWMNSFGCGGGKAKWNIGYEENKCFYKQSYRKGDAFILALNKYPTDINNDLKYMIQVNPIKFKNNKNAGECWTQDGYKDNIYSLTIIRNANITR